MLFNNATTVTLPLLNFVFVSICNESSPQLYDSFKVTIMADECHISRELFHSLIDKISDFKYFKFKSLPFFNIIYDVSYKFKILWSIKKIFIFSLNKKKNVIYLQGVGSLMKNKVLLCK